MTAERVVVLLAAVATIGLIVGVLRLALDRASPEPSSDQWEPAVDEPFLPPPP